MTHHRAARGSSRQLSDRDFSRLLSVRTGLREFERWSALEAEAHGVTASQHQLLLAVRGDDHPGGPTIGQVAQYLLIRPHSAVELVNRTEKAGLIHRSRDPQDHRAVRLRLSTSGEQVLTALTSTHLEELTRLGTLFASLTAELGAR